MVQLADIVIDDEHPLALEFASLRSTVARFQDEAYKSSLKLQRYSLDSANAHERILQLERENTLLKSEISVLRANPHPDTLPHAHPAALQVQQLTLSLRRLSDKLSLTEDALFARTTELAHAQSEVVKAKHAMDGAYELAARTRGREEEGKVRERELEQKVKATEEQMKMSDLVVNEYADLVRSLEGRTSIRTTPQPHTDSSVVTDSNVVNTAAASSSNSTITLVDSLSEGKSGLQKLLSEFSTETEHLQAELARLHEELAISQTQYEAERKGAEHDRIELAKVQSELQKLKLDDNVAAKMVSRYMKFSQKSTDVLQLALTSLKTRHAATIDTFSTQLSMLSAELQSSNETTERLRHALDEVGGDIMKETYGRRREVALRIRMVGREEKLREAIERWVRRAEEALEREAASELGRATFEKMITGAQAIMATLDGPSDTESTSGPFARIMAAQNAATTLLVELQAETVRRLELEKRIAQEPLTPPNAAYQDIRIEKGDLDINSSSPLDEGLVQENPQSSPTAILQDVHIDLPKSLSETATTAEAQSPPQSLSQKAKEMEIEPQLPLVLHGEPTKPPLDKRSIDVHLPIITRDDTPHSTLTTLVKTPPSPFEPTQRAYNDSPPLVPIEAHHAIIVSLDESHQHTSPIIRVANGEDSAGEDPKGEPPSPTSPDSAVGISGRVGPLVMQSATIGSPLLSPVLLPTSPATPPPSGMGAKTEPRSPPILALKTELLDLLTPVENPLLKELATPGRRYDSFQRAFRDCNLALEALKKSLPSSPNRFPSDRLSDAPGPSSHTSPEVLKAALERLNDYTEDVRVEVEIRTADEALLARGFETLLSVPGALASSTPSPSGEHPHGDDSEPTRSEIESQIEAFTSGTDPTIEKAQQNFRRKLDDLQHDIAVLKRAIHESEISASPPTTPTSESPSHNAWSSWISPARSSKAVPGLGSGPPPTFGNIMTTPRLRHSPSLNFPGRHKQPPPSESKDPFTNLGLRIPMPSYVQVDSRVSDIRAVPRTRTLSTMYMLGLGARSTSASFASPPRPQRLPPLRTPEPEPELENETETETDGETEEDDDTDVE